MLLHEFSAAWLSASVLIVILLGLTRLLFLLHVSCFRFIKFWMFFYVIMMEQYLVIYTPKKKKGFKACVVASLVCLGNASVIESSTIGTACIFYG